MAAPFSGSVDIGFLNFSPQLPRRSLQNQSTRILPLITIIGRFAGVTVPVIACDCSGRSKSETLPRRTPVSSLLASKVARHTYRKALRSPQP